MVKFAKRIMPGSYTLYLESYDELSQDKRTLYTDIITLTVTWQPEPDKTYIAKCPISTEDIKALQT